jgi:hypothetical protein
MKYISGISATTLLLCLLTSKTCAFLPSPSIPTATHRPQWHLHAESIKITMPALSSTMKEGRVVSWLKSEGDAIEAGEAIMVVESDKADMDVEAFEDGYLAKILTGEVSLQTVSAFVKNIFICCSFFYLKILGRNGRGGSRGGLGRQQSGGCGGRGDGRWGGRAGCFGAGGCC